VNYASWYAIVGTEAYASAALIIPPDDQADNEIHDAAKELVRLLTPGYVSDL
jgi:hypothetical protein